MLNDLRFLRPHAQSSVLGERAEHQESEQPVEVLTCNDQWDGYSSGESGDSKSDDDYADDTRSFSKIRPTRAGREGVLTRRMED